MAGKSFKQEFAEELFCKALVTVATTGASIVLAAPPVAVPLAVAATILVATPTVLGSLARNASQSKE